MIFRLRPAILAGLLLGPLATSSPSFAQTVNAAGMQFTNHGLVAVGRLPANHRDKFGETMGSGSGMAIIPSTWRKTDAGFEGRFMLLPDRGYNVAGTTQYQPRVNTITIRIPSGPVTGDPQKSAAITLDDTLMLTDAGGQPTTGLDAEAVRPAAGGLPDLPAGTNGRVAIDAEAIVRMPDGSFFVSDEYGPYIYRFSAEGRMLSAIRPPEALIPMRKGVQNFASNNPGAGAVAPVPPNPEAGRQNNQGFEGMALTPDGKTLVTILQSAARQDGGDAPATRNFTRALFYDITDPTQPKLVAEHVVSLPVFKDAKGATLVAAQSELLAISDKVFLLLARDSGNGYGMQGTTSLYRKVGVLDFTGATNIAGTAFDGDKPVAPKGVLDGSVTPGKLTDFIDLNDAAQLGRFGLHSGTPNDKDNLSEKWEAMAIANAMDPARPEDFFLFVVNDNDFLTQDGFQVGAPYKDASGADVDTMLLVYRVTLPVAR